MKICITGGAGMIGSSFVKYLLDKGIDSNDIFVIDNLWRGKKEYLEVNGELAIPSENFFELDLATDEIPKELVVNTDVLIHLADIVAGIGYVFNNQYEIFRQNNMINTNTFNAFCQANISKIIYVGTACSFPQALQNGLEAELKETQLFPAEPESAYGWSKLMGQLELRYLAESKGINTTTLMFHNVYGINTDYDSNRSQVIPSIINRVIDAEDNSSIEVWGSGSQGRAFVHVDDICTALYSSLNVDTSEYIQIGPSKCTSIKEIVERVIDISGKSLTMNFDLSKPEGDKGRFADYSLANKELNWSPKVDLNHGLYELYHWIKNEKNQ